MRVVMIILFLFFCSVNAIAAPLPADLSVLFPESGHLAGWTRVDEPRRYHGDELFLMIDGGADIYHEYGFSQALAGEYENTNGKFIQLEIYEMESPEAAYGIYSFKAGNKGQIIQLGQEALLEEYYLNFRKGNLLVTVVGSDAEKETIQAVIAMGRYVDEHYTRQGDLPELAKLLRNEPFSFTHPKYVRGSIGVMNSYIFDTEDIFKVREGMIGSIDNNQAFVFRYSDDNESSRIFANATTRFSSNTRFSDVVINNETCSMVDRNLKRISMRRAGQDIVIIIGEDRASIELLVEQVVKKLN